MQRRATSPQIITYTWHILPLNLNASYHARALTANLWPLDWSGEPTSPEQKFCLAPEDLQSLPAQAGYARHHCNADVVRYRVATHTVCKGAEGAKVARPGRAWLGRGMRHLTPDLMHTSSQTCSLHKAHPPSATCPWVYVLTHSNTSVWRESDRETKSACLQWYGYHSDARAYPPATHRNRPSSKQERILDTTAPAVLGTAAQHVSHRGAWPTRSRQPSSANKKTSQTRSPCPYAMICSRQRPPRCLPVR